MKISKRSGVCRLLAMFCAVVVLTVSALADTTVLAGAETKEGTLSVSSKTVERGDKFYITVDLKNNPGIWGMKFRIGYDHSALTLTSVQNGNVFGDEDVSWSTDLNKEESVYLAYLNTLQNNTANGTVLKLEFTASNTAEFKPYIISLKIDQAINVKEEDIAVQANDGAVSVVKCIHVNDTKWSSDANTHWHNCVYADCKEKILKTVEKHRVVNVAAVEATCEKSGLTSGKKCSVCGYVIQKQEVINAKGHTPVVLAAVKATTQRSGLTKGKKCSVCGKILVAQKTIPKIAYKMKKPATTSKKVKMYQKKSKSSKVIKTIKKGKKITILDMKKGWYLVKYSGKVGYVPSSSVVWTGKVKTGEGSLRLRAGEGKKYKIINTYPKGTKVKVIGNNIKGWYKVRIKKQEGYMASQYIG
ncbi:MAG: SH3 domain-containing protein [Eubacterium sp.]|nr:SH3 domain-containing protein [Eubacterium sp.]